MLSFANSFPLLVASISASITKINFQTDSKITDLMRVFSALENNEKLVLCVLAIVHKPITIKEFERLVTLLDGADLLVEVPGMYFLTPERRERLLFKALLRNFTRSLLTANTHG
jgi:hypothetical protein